MVQKAETGDGIVGHDNQLAATTQVNRKRFDQNYGAMTMVMRCLPLLEQLKMQGLDKWQYVTGVSRVQVRLEMQKMCYFNYPGELFIVAVSKTDEQQQFEFKGESEFTNYSWFSCQVGRSRLF